MHSGNAYRNQISGDCIAEFLSKELKEHLQLTEFYSVLTDCSAGANTMEEECIFVVKFDHTLQGSEDRY